MQLPDRHLRHQFNWRGGISLLATFFLGARPDHAAHGINAESEEA
jgi:hypothetical protein